MGAGDGSGLSVGTIDTLGRCESDGPHDGDNDGSEDGDGDGAGLVVGSCDREGFAETVGAAEGSLVGAGEADGDAEGYMEGVAVVINVRLVTVGALVSNMTSTKNWRAGMSDRA